MTMKLCKLVNLHEKFVCYLGIIDLVKLLVFFCEIGYDRENERKDEAL